METKLCQLKNDDSNCVWVLYSRRGDGKPLIHLAGYNHIIKCVDWSDLVEYTPASEQGQNMKATSFTWTADEFIEKGSGVICLCGSTKYFFEALEANRRLTFNNWIVLQCGSWGHSFHKYTENTNTDYSLVKKLHYQKILLSDAIVIVSDHEKYVGNSTKAETKFAQHIGLPVFYFDGREFSGTTTERPPKRLADTALIDEFEKINGDLGF